MTNILIINYFTLKFKSNSIFLYILTELQKCSYLNHVSGSKADWLYDSYGNCIHKAFRLVQNIHLSVGISSLTKVVAGL